MQQPPGRNYDRHQRHARAVFGLAGHQPRDQSLCQQEQQNPVQQVNGEIDRLECERLEAVGEEIVQGEA